MSNKPTPHRAFNTDRYIWISTTVLFCIIGLAVGWSLGKYFCDLRLYDKDLVPQPMKPVVNMTITLGFGIVVARLGSWLAEHHIIQWMRRFHQLSAADRILSITGALLGLVFGVLVTVPLSLPDNQPLLWLPVKFCVMLVSAVLGMGVLQGMRAEMLRVLPQLEPPSSGAGAGGGSIPKLLDTNVIIDGRLADLCKTGFIEGPILVPHFVLEEVQFIADSADSTRRARGRRGLEVLNSMRDMTLPQNNGAQTENVPMVKVINEIPASVQRNDTVDSKLLFLAKEMRAKIITNDFNLNRVAELQGVKVLNINELAQALKPVVLPGEEMNLTIVKEGKEPGQGVGYLEDGTMVVVTEGQRHVGETCKVVISSVYQTVAGKMIFADLKSLKGAGDDLFHERHAAGHSAGHSASGSKSGDDFSYRPGSGPRRKGKP